MVITIRNNNIFALFIALQEKSSKRTRANGRKTEYLLPLPGSNESRNVPTSYVQTGRNSRLDENIFMWHEGASCLGLQFIDDR